MNADAERFSTQYPLFLTSRALSGFLQQCRLEACLLRDEDEALRKVGKSVFKRKNPTTLTDIRRLLLRIATLVTLVGVSGALLKEGAFAQVTHSPVLTSQNK